MNYEILTPRWTCPECGAHLSLYFSPQGAVEENEEAQYAFQQVQCLSGHFLPEDLVVEIAAGADQEFSTAFERGSKVGETWLVPSEAPVDQVPSDMPPPEE